MNDAADTPVAPDQVAVDAHHANGHAGDGIHLPPPSWVPLNVALALAVTFVGLLVHPLVWILGAVWLLGSFAAWALAARHEFLDLP